MCGIVGMVSKRRGFYLADVSAFSQMLVADSVRGIDGTGVFGTYGTGSVGWLKVGAHPYALLTSKKFDSWSQAMVRKMDMVVGHNRKATAGSKNNENAHPFIHEHIILVHNGVIQNHKEMATTEVDSHAIAHSIVDKGHIETLKNLEGAFALVWFDMKDRTLRIVRNSQRPMYMVETDSQIIFASEGPMITWLGDRNTNKDWDKSKLIDPGVLVSISQITKEIKTEKVELYTWKSKAGFPTYNHRHHYTESCGWEYGTEAWNTELDNAIAEDTTHPFGNGTGDEDDNVDPVGEAIRADMPDLEDEEVKKVEDFIRTYGDGTQVTFVPKSMLPWNSNVKAIAGYNLEGELRGDPTVKVRASFEGVNVFKDVEKLLERKVLKGTVFGSMVNPATGAKHLQVRHVTGLEVYLTFNGTKLTSDEWIAICDKHKCLQCKKKLKIMEIELTSVNIKNPENVRVFCPTCVKEHMNKLPPERKQHIQEHNKALGNVIDIAQKEWDLRGSTHGS